MIRPSLALLLVLATLLVFTAPLPYDAQMTLANSLIVGRDDQSDLYNWECKVCDNYNKPIHAHFVEEKAKDVKAILSVYPNFMVLAFRYTATALNLWQDILYPLQIKDQHTCSNCKVQKAYHTMWEVIKNDIFNDLKEMKEQTGIETLYITGISLGGGLSVISYIDVAHYQLFNDVKVITWGAPRVGNKHWAAHFDLITSGNTKRYFIKGDPIVVMPRCLTLLCTYRQTGIKTVCYEKDHTCVQEQDSDESYQDNELGTLSEEQIRGREIQKRNQNYIDKDVRSVKGIMDHINGYPKIYNYTLIVMQ